MSRASLRAFNVLQAALTAKNHNVHVPLQDYLSYGTGLESNHDADLDYYKSAASQYDAHKKLHVEDRFLKVLAWRMILR